MSLGRGLGLSPSPPVGVGEQQGRSEPGTGGGQSPRCPWERFRASTLPPVGGAVRLGITLPRDGGPRLGTAGWGSGLYPPHRVETPPSSPRVQAGVQAILLVGKQAQPGEKTCPSYRANPFQNWFQTGAKQAGTRQLFPVVLIMSYPWS